MIKGFVEKKVKNTFKKPITLAKTVAPIVFATK